MIHDPNSLRRTRALSIVLVVSGGVNVALLTFVLFWMAHDAAEAPYLEFKPAREMDALPVMSDSKGGGALVAKLQPLSRSELMERLDRTEIVENGFAERDFALGCLVSFHHFDITRALGKEVGGLQKRRMHLTLKGKEVSLILFPGLTQSDFDAVLAFAKNEVWPLTAKGLFQTMKEQKELRSDEVLKKAFFLTPEFWSVELLFKRTGTAISQDELLEMLLQGSWERIEQFVTEMAVRHDTSEVNRQKFLLDYLQGGSTVAATLMLQSDFDAFRKKMSDEQVIALLQTMPSSSPHAVAYAKEILVSPRSAAVWQAASAWLFVEAKEVMPADATHATVLKRFTPDKIATAAKKAKQEISSSSLPTATKSPTKGAAGAMPLALKSAGLEKAGGGGKSVSLPSPKNASKGESQNKPKTVPVVLATPAKKQPVAPQRYVVQEGDTLWKIANRFGVGVDELKTLNHLSSDRLKTGAELKIPPTR